MVDVDDVQLYALKYQNQLQKLKEANIDERDREAILEVIHALDATGELNDGTLGARMNHLRLSSERAQISLVEMGEQDVNKLLMRLKREYGLAEGTRRNYRKSLKKFFEHRNAQWIDDFTIGVPPDRSVDPDDLLTDEEITALLDAAENPRDKALVALLADTGLRIGAVASLRVQDIDFEGPTAMLTINEAGNVKGASGTVPLTWSEGYVASWLDVHPRREPDAALIHKYRGYYDGTDDGAMSYQYLSGRVKKIADIAGVDRSRVNTHNFRKTAISRWIREGLSEQAIKHRATWDVDSDQLQTYSGVRDEELNEHILDHYGVETASDQARPSLDVCPRCGTPLREADEYCGSCGAALTDGAAERVQNGRAQLRELNVDLSDAEDRAKLQTLLDEYDDDPTTVHGNSSSR